MLAKIKELFNLKEDKQIIKKLILGIIAGLVSGFFASGGGMILVPAYVYILKMEDSKARATSIFCILPMVIASGIFYYKNKYIDWKIGILCAIGGIIGGYIGARLLKKLPDKYLKLSFALFLIYVSIRLISGS